MLAGLRSRIIASGFMVGKLARLRVQTHLETALVIAERSSNQLESALIFGSGQHRNSDESDDLLGSIQRRNGHPQKLLAVTLASLLDHPPSLLETMLGRVYAPPSRGQTALRCTGNDHGPPRQAAWLDAYPVALPGNHSAHSSLRHGRLFSCHPFPESVDAHETLCPQT